MDKVQEVVMQRKIEVSQTELFAEARSFDRGLKKCRSLTQSMFCRIDFDDNRNRYDQEVKARIPCKICEGMRTTCVCIYITDLCVMCYIYCTSSICINNASKDEQQCKRNNKTLVLLSIQLDYYKRDELSK